ncbi:hypothetical protein BN973_02957 [Mycobacterium triplex]|uniref:Uncharacterized protein n=1 Tax=Mycobacterium triplex TaxID=47839 RepID=A0A024JZA6_9MYCO|nr:hypothetical protein BN973_02957 [Mycobacterium triplex]
MIRIGRALKALVCKQYVRVVALIQSGWEIT